MHRIRCGDVELNVADRGRGPVIVLVHGFPLDHTMWQGQIDELAGSFRVLAPDLRGFGASDPVDADAILMEQFADDLAALLDALAIEEPITFCALSMGGYIAWQFWRRHAARLGRLILCDTRAVADTPEARQSRLETARRVLEHGTAIVADAMLPKLFAEATARRKPELVEAMRQVMFNTAPATVAAALRGMAARTDATSWLGEIRVPTLVVCGRHDVISPAAEMRGIAASIPGARFVEIADVGHMSPLESPESVNDAIVDFAGA